jgi:hypothetical protein
VFAAARYLQDSFGGSARVTYIHSKQTKEEAERIESVLRARGEYKSVHPFDPQQCERNLREMLAEVSGNVHLHYTGGTKCMGVETALYLSKRCNLELSYLDASRQALNRGHETVDDLRRHVTLGLDELAGLHGVKPPHAQLGAPVGDDPLWSGLAGQPVFPRLNISHDGQFVHLIYGYHLLLVCDQRMSVKPNEAKKAAFEAFLRARQRGGDEARVLMVTPFEFESGRRPTDKDLRRDFPQHPEEPGRINGTPVFVWTTADGEPLGKKWARLFDALRWFS